jgi:hypothetical protein
LIIFEKKSAKSILIYTLIKYLSQGEIGMTSPHAIIAIQASHLTFNINGASQDE